MAVSLGVSLTACISAYVLMCIWVAIPQTYVLSGVYLRQYCGLGVWRVPLPDQTQIGPTPPLHVNADYVYREFWVSRLLERWRVRKRGVSDVCENHLSFRLKHPLLTSKQVRDIMVCCNEAWRSGGMCDFELKCLHLTFVSSQMDISDKQ